MIITWKFKPVLRSPTFTLIFRRSLHNLIGCSARMEVSQLINVSSRATFKINEKTSLRNANNEQQTCNVQTYMYVNSFLHAAVSSSMNLPMLGRQSDHVVTS